MTFFIKFLLLDFSGHQFLWLMTNLSHALALTVTIAYFAVEFPHSELFNPEKRPEELSGWKVYLEMFCNFNYHLVQVRSSQIRFDFT